MLFNTAVVGLFPVVAALAGAQSIQELASQIPKCAMTCIQNTSPQVGCPKLDSVCHCKKQEQLLPAAEGCFTSTCTEQEIQAYQEFVPQVCDILVPNSPTSAVPSTSCLIPTGTPSATPSIGPSSTPTGPPIFTGMAAPAPGVGLGAAGVIAVAHLALM